MNVQVIERDGKPEWAVLPYEEYERLLEEAEMLQDIRAYDQAKQALAEGEELVPSEVAYAIMDGENPIRIWRQHRGLTQTQLAQAAGIRVSHLERIESGTCQATTVTLSAIAKSLKLDLDDLSLPKSSK
jgi:ribosome-binding protein aMBF1 (putative translation factor)